MIYPHNFEQKVGFDQIRMLISEACVSPMGKAFVEKIRFSPKKEVIEKLLTQSNEFMHILTFGQRFPTNDYFDLRTEIARLKTPGTYIEQEALFDFKASLTTINEVLLFFKDSDEDLYPELKKITSQVYIPQDLLNKAEKIIDDKGDIRDNASPNLNEIRNKLNQKGRQVLKEIKKTFEQAKKSGWVADNSEITIRNGRSVIPMRASDKRAIGGFIHDESSTGQTVFVEPAASFELSNQIRELENEERREIIRILISFTDDLRPYIQDLISAYRFLGMMDFIRAKASFSLRINASSPIISNAQSLEIKNAFHPLLWLSHSKQDKEVIPLDLSLNEENRILLISGPNAGGKSVCLKTTGLLQYMLQCGLPIPVSPNSEMRLFQNLFIDIGDEQSLENDLSTYSSHLLNMKHFMQNANEKTLFLIDEFGTGTEPQLGGAIAEATLELLNEKKAFGLITTHYSNLKVAADKNEGLINGAMLFDSKEMRPLYKLQVGTPGSSFAFEIAKKIGFPKHVLIRAKKKSGGKHVRFDQQLQQLETDKIMLQKQQQKVDSVDDQLSKTVEKYTNLLRDLEKSKKQIMADAKVEALKIIEGSNKAVEKTIREIKESQAEKSKTREIREELELTKAELKGIARKKKEDRKVGEKSRNLDSRRRKSENVPKPGKTIVRPQIEIKTSKIPVVGDYVRVKDTDICGQLISVSGDDAVVNVNDIKLKTSLEKLERTQKPNTKPRPYKSAFSGIISDINKKAANFKLTLDLRGKRADEAISELQKYIDEALIISVKEVSILHGTGNGILRPIIREYLDTVDEIKYFGNAPVDQGGSGITLIVFD
jgi:DNA mismatch repair protein MutS2